MKIIIILLGLGLTIAFVFPTILDTIFEASLLDTIFENQIVKTLLLYAGLIVLIGGLGGIADWLEDKAHSNRDEIKT